MVRELEVSRWHLNHRLVQFSVFLLPFPDDNAWFFNWLADTEGSLSAYVYTEPISSSKSYGNNVFCTLRNHFFSVGKYRKLN